MTRSHRRERGLSAPGGRWGLLPALALTLVMAPAAAQAGFFEQLFGMQPTPEAQPPAVDAPLGRNYAPPRKRRPARPRVSEIGTGRQTPTDLMHDKTLRRGDAVMMKGGFRVFEGARVDVHTPGEFVPLDRSGLPRSARMTLAAVDTTSPAADGGGGPGKAGAAGRSAAIDAPEVVVGTMIVDPRGKRVRYIGP